MLTVIKLRWFPKKQTNPKTTCDFVTKEAESREDRKEKKEKKRMTEWSRRPSQTLSGKPGSTYTNSRAQMEPDVIDEFTTETCDSCASNSGGRNVPSGISTRFMSILAGRQEKNKYHGATAEKKKLKNRKTAEGEKSKTGKEIDPSMLKRK